MRNVAGLTGLMLGVLLLVGVVWYITSAPIEQLLVSPDPYDQEMTESIQELDRQIQEMYNKQLTPEAFSEEEKRILDEYQRRGQEIMRKYGKIAEEEAR